MHAPLTRAPERVLVLAANSSWNLLNFCRNLISGMQVAGYKVVVIVPEDDDCDELRNFGVEVHTVPLKQHALSPLSDLRLLASYLQLLRRIRPEAYLGITAKPNIYGGIAAKLCGIPVIASVTGLGTAYLGSKPLEMLVSSMYRAAFFRAEKVFFLNRDDYNLFTERRIVKPAIAEILPGSGIDLDWFRLAPPSRNEALVFLFIGRVLTDKGVCEFLEAARSVKKKIPNARFQILGPTGSHPKAVPDELLNSYVDDGTVEVLGSTDDVRPYIQAADCIVLPSYREGLPRVLVEASAMGRPMIASDVPGCRDVVDDGVTGYLCDARSARSLEEAILAFARNSPEERARMGEAARRKVERQFLDRDFIDAYLRALSSVVPERHRLIAVSANTAWALTNYRMRLLKTLRAQGFSVTAIVPNDKDVPKLTDAGIRVSPISINPHGTSPVSELFLLLQYIALLRRLKPVAYLGFTIKPNVYGGIAGAFTGVPVINNVTGLGIVFARGGILRVAVGQLCRVAFRRSHRVFFQNRESLELFRSLHFVRDDQVALLPGSGIDLERFVPARTEKADPESFTFLLAGRLIWEKGVAEFCEAARLFRERRPKVKFQLLGFIEPPSNKSAVSRSQIDAWVAEGIIEYLGSTDDIRPFFAAADCIVLPSFYPEGVPRALIEAAAMGKPGITTDTPGCRDAVNDGETGYLCEARSVESLVQAMTRMLDLSRAQREDMGRRARRKAEMEFDEQQVIDSYEQALAELAGGLEVARSNQRQLS